MRAWIRQHPFLSFYLIAVGFPVVLFSYLMALERLFPDLFGPGIGTVQHFYATKAAIAAAHPLLAQHNDSILLQLAAYAAVPLGAPFFFFPFAPTVSALIVTAIGRGGAAVRGLLGAYLPVRGALGGLDGVRLYARLLGSLVLVLALTMLGESLGNGGERLAEFSRIWGLGDITLLAVGWGAALFFNQGGLLEELGWRGYGWPVLTRLFRDPLAAALLLGSAWAMWHFPREIGPLLQGQQGIGTLIAGQLAFIAMCCGMTIVAVSLLSQRYSNNFSWLALSAGRGDWTLSVRS